MVCHACGKTVADGDRFCTGCGTRLQPAPGDVADRADVDGQADSTTTPESPVAGAQGPITAPDAAADASEAVSESTPAEPTTAEPATAGPTPAEPTPTPATAGPTPAEPTPASPADTTTDEPTPDEPTPTGEARTELLPLIDDDDWGADDPVWAATAPTPITGGPTVATSDLPATEPVTEVWMESVPDETAAHATPYDFVEREPVGATQAMPTATAQMPAVVAVQAPAVHRFRFGAVTFLAVVTGLVTLAGLFTTIVSIDSDARLTIGADAPFGFRTGTWIADDLANNLSIAGLLAAVLMVAGGIAAAFGWRWGSGLAGGSGLAVAGLVGLALGLAQIPIDAAHEFAQIPPDEPFTLTITRDVGYWTLLAAGALGIIVFFASINDAFGDRRAGLNPWIAALGALGTVVAAGGPLLPENLADFSDNLYLTDGPGEAPALLLASRLAQLGLFAVAGVVGFLSVRRWGLGVAIGGTVPAIWLAISTLFELTDAPVGPGFRNPGADDMHLHGVTIIGISAVAAIAVLAVIAAYDQGVRERR